MSQINQNNTDEFMLNRTAVMMFILSSFLLILTVVAEDNPSQEYLNNNNELTKDEEEPYCGKINMDADDITFTTVEGKEDTIALKWTEAFKKDNVDLTVWRRW